MSEEAKLVLLSRVRAATVDLEEAKVERLEALRAAMDAGIPRREIAEAAGMSYQAVFDLLKRHSD